LLQENVTVKNMKTILTKTKARAGPSHVRLLKIDVRVLHILVAYSNSSVPKKKYPECAASTKSLRTTALQPTCNLAKLSLQP
jgi:hypothetical protein